MSFQQFYGPGEKISYSTLGEIPETLYDTAERERSFQAGKAKKDTQTIPVGERRPALLPLG